MHQKSHLSGDLINEYLMPSKRKYHREPDLKRINKKVISFNNKELTAIEIYCKKYRIDNRSQFMRETIISAVLKKFTDDYPSLWEDPQLKLFSNY